MPNKTDKKFSTRVLKEAKEVVRELQDRTSEMSCALSILDAMNNDTAGLFDRQIIHECSEMIGAINRLMYEQEAKLRHMQMMQISDTRAEFEYGRFKNMYAASKSKSVFKN